MRARTHARAHTYSLSTPRLMVNGKRFRISGLENRRLNPVKDCPAWSSRHPMNRPGDGQKKARTRRAENARLPASDTRAGAVLGGPAIYPWPAAIGSRDYAGFCRAGFRHAYGWRLAGGTRPVQSLPFRLAHPVAARMRSATRGWPINLHRFSGISR